MTKVAILGAGESGTGAAVLAKIKGFEVFVSDKGTIAEKYKNVLCKNDIEWEEGKHSEARILDANEIIKSPGIPDNADLILKAKAAAINIISEIEFAARYTNAKKICITGTNGKTTTTMLTYHILKNAGFNVAVGGNVGKSFAHLVATGNYDYYVLEISSFQLDNMFDFKADIAIMTNITPDHLNRYDYDMNKYIDSKFRIIQNQEESDFFIYNSDDPIICEWLEKNKVRSTLIPFSIKKELDKGAYIKEKQIIIKLKEEEEIMSIYGLAIQGQHNVYNTLAAAVGSRLLEIRNPSLQRSLNTFQAIEHRLEHVLTVHGIEYINDSKATNINSTWYALECQEKPVIWIAGGEDKGNDYTLIEDLVREKVKAIICLGINNLPIIKHFAKLNIPIIETTNMNDAIKASYQLGKKGDTVLLSPACASFDLFENYEDRGRQFKKFVRNL